MTVVQVHTRRQPCHRELPEVEKKRPSPRFPLSSNAAKCVSECPMDDVCSMFNWLLPSYTLPFTGRWTASC